MASGDQGAFLRVQGIVQGVGFRPFVYGLALRFGLTGWVRNTSAGVEIALDGSPQALEDFTAALQAGLPPLARIDSLEASRQPPSGFSGFTILDSEAVAGAFQPISPDVSLCPDCLAELGSPADRRYRYPFINCTNCGPRFTIITDIPYDRPNTTMAAFPMCPDCRREYEDPLNRRFHAQPVACPVCGPAIWLEKSGSEQAVCRGEAALQAARRLLQEGGILAVKGLGGFHLACDAASEAAVAELRRRKLRVDKPFALMAADLDAVARSVRMTAEERELLESRARPIVLLERRPDAPLAAGVAPGQSSLGFMLPYTPLHVLLLERAEGFPEALVMTSGNLSEEPIATGNAEARSRLGGLADALLLHDREIHTRCDDSVMRLFAGRAYPLRRARGLAPDPLRLPFELPPLLAAGPELKNTFCLTRQEYAFVSHHIGDMQNLETLQSYEQSVGHYERLFRIQPERLACDLHPDYLATRYARQRSEREGLPLTAVQHHHAHIAACLADNGHDGSTPVIGIAFDGTGYGSDGAIWGGEVLLADYCGFERLIHLRYFPLAGGDAAVRQPARTALALLWSLGIAWDESLAPCRSLSPEACRALRLQLERNLNAPPTSSLGRLFDAAAALAGVRQAVNYEAQAAIEFETLAGGQPGEGYPFTVHDGLLDPEPAVRALLEDLRSGVPGGFVSQRFHLGVARMVLDACRHVRAGRGLQTVALSGGVWQNRRLLELSVPLLQADGFKVLVHHRIPANDGGVSLGQACIAARAES